jgi:hypothetical protein
MTSRSGWSITTMEPATPAAPDRTGIRVVVVGVVVVGDRAPSAGSGHHEDACAGEGTDADVSTVDLDRDGAVR